MRNLFLSVLIMSLTGCAAFGLGGTSEYSCPGMPSGAVCKSPSQVYQMTHKSMPEMDQIQQSAPDGAGTGSSYDGLSLKLGKPAAAASGLFAGQPMPSMPILEPAKVMRIWIAPWQTKNEDLVWPSYVFVEVTPKKWAFGEMSVTNVKPLVPLQVDAISAEQQSINEPALGAPSKMPGNPAANFKAGAF